MTIELDLFYNRMRKEIMISQDASTKVDEEKRHAYVHGKEMQIHP